MPSTHNKRDRDGDSVNPIIQRLKDNHRSEWPADAELDKFIADIDTAATSKDKAVSEKAVGQFARFMYKTHDKPHDSKIEWWYVSGHLGHAKSDPTKAYSFFAAFFRLHIAGDKFAHCVHWAITEAPAVKNAFSSSGASSATTAPAPPLFNAAASADQTIGMYHTFASQDPITPTAILKLYNEGRFKTADKRVTQQILTMACANVMPSPEKMFAEGAAVVRGTSTPTAEGNNFETLYVEVDGNSFSAVMPEGSDSPVYTLKLKGESQNNLENNGKSGKGFDISLELTFSPMVSKGFGPVLHGKKGVVSVKNFEDDMFYYFTPRCALVGATADERFQSVALKIDNTPIELVAANGEDERIWVDHEFGGVPAKTEEEVAALNKSNAAFAEVNSAADYNWDWGAFHIPGLGSVSMAIVREQDPKVPPKIWGSVHPEYEVCAGGPIVPPFSVFFDGEKPANDPSQPIRIEADPSVPKFSSPDSGMVFPTAFIIHIPSFKNLRLRTVVAIPQQEFINMIAKPSYLEGRCNVEANWSEADGTSRSVLTGMGFLEARGELNTAQIEQVTMLTHATVFMPVEMQPAPPSSLVPALPAAVVPTVTATITMMMQFAPPPKPKPNQIAFLAATVATYSALFHYGGVEADALRFIDWWVDEKRKFLTAMDTPLVRAGIKDIGMAAMMTKELEGVIARKVPSVAAAVAAGGADAAEAPLKFILVVEDAKFAPVPTLDEAESARPATSDVQAEPSNATQNATEASSAFHSSAAPSGLFDPSAIVAMASAAGITIPPALLADPMALIAMAKSAGIPIPDSIVSALASVTATATPPASFASAAQPATSSSPSSVLSAVASAASAVPNAVLAAATAAAGAAPTQLFDPSAIVAMASAAGITIPPALLADPVALIAMAKSAGIPIPDTVVAAVSALSNTNNNNNNSGQ